MNRQERAMIKTMEKMNFKLQEDLMVDLNIDRPIQNLFDECLNFISINDFNV